MAAFPESTFVSTTHKRKIDQWGIRGLYRRNYQEYENLTNPTLEQVLNLPEIESIYIDSDRCIHFYCGGAAFGSSSMYTAIWYAPDAVEEDFCRGTSKQDGTGVAWEAQGDYGYTEEIADGFFFTEEYT